VFYQREQERLDLCVNTHIENTHTHRRRLGRLTDVYRKPSLFMAR
jgi:hypothetical protein